MARRRAAKTVDELLAQARATLPDRPSPAEALHAQASDALLIDIREDDQRREDGLIPGAIVLPRNSLEWRCDPASEWRHPAGAAGGGWPGFVHAHCDHQTGSGGGLAAQGFTRGVTRLSCWPLEKGRGWSRGVNRVPVPEA
ncbi:MAG TPA: hypothetical protein VGQ26_17615 [Streptosporangiaceae bacterium]|jgi:hypothetical protein|nr:hypothetical protein [Streptosporangiaceae bacterium]